jgi:glycosyltransferase involved in cell wall biosynthesis
MVRRLAARVQVENPPPNAGRLSAQAWEQLILPHKVFPGDLLWSPANTGPLAVRRQVVTLHDLAALEHPEWFAPAFAAWYRSLIPRLARRAAGILTVSRFSKERIAAVLDVPPERITVVHPGVGALFRPAGQERVAFVRQKYGLGERYFLWVGTLEPRKNWGALAAAWRIFNQKHRGISLVLCGATGGSPFRRSTPLDLPPAVIALGFTADEDLPALYSGALALAMPSLYEGFGLPALEAAACGTPALVSITAGVCEALGDDGLAVKPSDVDAIAAALERLATDEDGRRAIGCRAMQRAKVFTWERSAEAAYQALLAAPWEEAGRP